MQDILKKVRGSDFANRVVRHALKTSHSAVETMFERAMTAWRPSGVLHVTLCGQTFQIKASPDDGIAAHLYYGRPWEEFELQTWSRLCASAVSVLDIGANTGIYSLIAAQASPEAKIVAFEPAPANHQRLLENCVLNSCRNISVLSLALGEDDRIIQFTVPADGSLTTVSSAVDEFTRAHSALHGYTRISAEQRSLDSLMDSGELGPSDLVKLDVEYYEYEVLAGGRRYLAKHRPIILCEVFDYEYFCAAKPEFRGQIDPRKTDGVAGIFDDLDYSLYAVTPRGLHRVPDFHAYVSAGANYVCFPSCPRQSFLPFADSASWATARVP